MKVLFYTFPDTHLVSNKEFERLKKGFAKVGMELIRWHQNKGIYPDPVDVVMVKGFSHYFQDIHFPLGIPVVYLSIGTEWKIGGSPDLNDPIKELYKEADAVVHISRYCMESHWANFPGLKKNEGVIIPADEPKLGEFHAMHQPLKLATTCIPRPVKRVEQLQELCEKHNIELVPAWGSVSDFSYYHDCDGYIHLSRKEGMPNTVLEALAYGLPCIVTNYGGAKEAVGEAGVIIRTDPETGPWDPSNIEPVDEYLFIQAIQEFKDNYQKLFQKTHERVRSELNDFVCANKFKELFESL